MLIYCSPDGQAICIVGRSRSSWVGGAAGGAEALIVDRGAKHQEVAAGETSHPALITYTNLIDSDHMGNLSLPTPDHWRYPNI